MERYVITTDHHHWTNIHTLQHWKFKIVKKVYNQTNSGAQYIVEGCDLEPQLDELKYACKWVKSFNRHVEPSIIKSSSVIEFKWVKFKVTPHAPSTHHTHTNTLNK